MGSLPFPRPIVWSWESKTLKKFHHVWEKTTFFNFLDCFCWSLSPYNNYNDIKLFFPPLNEHYRMILNQHIDSELAKCCNLRVQYTKTNWLPARPRRVEHWLKIERDRTATPLFCGQLQVTKQAQKCSFLVCEMRFGRPFIRLCVSSASSRESLQPFVVYWRGAGRMGRKGPFAIQ